MKRYCLLTILLLLISTSLFAQAEQKVTWIAEEDKFVETTPKAIVYELPGKPQFYSWRLDYASDFRYVVNYDGYKTKTLKKPRTLLVRGFANRNKQLEYDTYVVEIKGVLHFLPCEYVSDNSLIGGVNGELNALYHDLQSKQVDYKRQLDSLVAYHTQECQDRIAYYQQQKAELPSIIDSVKNQAKANYRAIEKAAFDEWYSAQPQSTRNAYKALSITEAGLSSPNSAAGCDYTFTYVNNSPKTIKYLYWSGTFYNAVDDPVACEIRGYRTFTGQDTGPVASGESGGGVWDCVIYNWSADYVKLSSVRIIYMDGSTMTIGAGDVKRLLTEPSSTDFFLEYGSEYGAMQDAAKPYQRQLDECELSVRLWEGRLDYLQRGRYNYPLSYDYDYEEVTERISKLYNEWDGVSTQLSSFEKENLLGNMD